MDKIVIEKLEICFGGYDFSKLEKKTRFSLQKSVEQSVKNFFSGMNIDIKEIIIGYDVDKLIGITISLFSTVSKSVLQSRFSENDIYNIIVKSIDNIFKENFGSIPRRFTCEFKDNETVKNTSDNEEESIEKLATRYSPVDPLYTFDNLIIGKETMDEIEIALSVLEHSDLVFEKWGLKKIEPFPRSVLNFYGPPGTGKTLAAHAIASKLGKKVLLVGCPEIQSKYHGESSKNVKAVFYAAEKNDAVLFFDESDSLLSKRLEEVNTGAEDEINNMRNTMLMCLEMHKGIVIFASNFVKRYDYAFETRVQSILFPIPDLDTLEKIWGKHLLPTIEKQGEINLHTLAEKTLGFCGRDVKNAVVKACFTAIHNGHMYITEQDILNSCERIRSAREDLKHADYSQVNINVSKNEPETHSLSEIISKKEENWKKMYLALVPCDAEMNVGNLVNASFELSDKEIRKAIDYACYKGYEGGLETISEENILDALTVVKSSMVQSSKNEESGLETKELKEAIKELIESRNTEI